MGRHVFVRASILCFASPHLKSLTILASICESLHCGYLPSFNFSDAELHVVIGNWRYDFDTQVYIFSIHVLPQILINLKLLKEITNYEIQILGILIC